MVSSTRKFPQKKRNVGERALLVTSTSLKKKVVLPVKDAWDGVIFPALTQKGHENMRIDFVKFVR